MDLRKEGDSDSDSETEINNTEDKGQTRYITDPNEYLEYCQKDKKIKIMDQINPIFNHVFLKDISLHKKGPLEDKIYSRVNNYYENIRRGNTLCHIYHPDQENVKNQSYDLFFCRRGMKKFYDLEPAYLKETTLTTNHQLMKNRIFQTLQQELEKPQATYHIYCLFKENGEHCQISYVKQLSSWLFASKNVAILARGPSDLKNHYHKQRFYWAKLIGQEFFNILNQMDEQTKESFKKDIEGFTLLGEHCGNQQHQHITKYDEVQIIFYGLVKNVGFDHCQPVDQCKQFLKKYGLKMSRCREKTGLKDRETIRSAMWEMLREVAQGSMNQEGEGSVMYIVCERENVQRTVGMCKLKTCQYLIYRRLREMLKLNVARKSTANTFQKFRFEIQELVKHYFQPPKPLKFYFQLGEKAFKQCGTNGEINETYLRYKFVEFISKFKEENPPQSVGTKQQLKRIILVSLPRMSNLVQKFCRGQGYQIDIMYRPGKPLSRTVIHILYMIPRLPEQLQSNVCLMIPKTSQKDINKCISQLQECKDLSKSQLISFIKSEDKTKTIKMLSEKIQVFRKKCQTNQIPFQEPEFTEESLIQTISQITESQQEKKEKGTAEKQSKSSKTFIFPLLIPGSGKSTLCRELLTSQSQFKWKVIDSDAIRRELMQEVEKINLNEDQSNKIFVQTGKEATQKFRETLLKEVSTQAKEEEYIFVDRIFSPYNIEQALQILFSLNKDNVRAYILTQSFQQTKLNDKTYPYSLNYLLTCLKRCLERTQHQTMPNNPYMVAKIVLKFYRMMANFSPKPISKRFEEKVHFVNLPIIEDSKEIGQVNQQLKKKVEQCLALVEPGSEAKESNSFIELVQDLYKFSQGQDNQNFEKYSTLVKLLEKVVTRKQLQQSL